MTRVFELPEPRHRHLEIVAERPRVSPRHPSMRPEMFDQEDADHAASECVLLTKIEAQAIIGVLRHARGHCPSPAALNDAIEILGGRP